MSTARILIVEDEANIRRFVGIALQDEGFQVFEADSVKRALIHAAHGVDIDARLLRAVE